MDYRYAWGILQTMERWRIATMDQILDYKTARAGKRVDIGRETDFGLSSSELSTIAARIEFTAGG